MDKKLWNLENRKNTFIKRALEKHDNKYDYSRIKYVNNRTKVCIVCPIHGEFWQTPESHLQTEGCSKCSKEKSASKRRYTKEQFIHLAKEKHGNKYDYSKVDYINSHTKVCIICPKHGEYWVTPYAHLAYECKKCVQEKQTKKHTHTSQQFIEKAISIHGDRYDYSKVDYTGSRNKVQIFCKIHGCFWQTPHDHLQGHGCSKCIIDKRLEISRKDFIKKAILKHGDLYLYEKTNYIDSRTPVCITCKKHGDFWQSPNAHLVGSGCPKCNRRRSQNEFYLKIKRDLNLDFDFDKRLPWLGMQSLDLYNSKYNFAIEYNGIQHYEPIEYFGGQKSFDHRCELDLNKQKLCEENNCKLWIVKYNFTSEDYEILIKEILNYING